MPFTRIRKPMHRYGQPDFDAEYLHWGFHKESVQREEAESILKLLPDRPLRLLDLACGIGRHAILWAQAAHQVTAVDLSETFIAHARQSAKQQRANLEFRVGDVRQLSFSAEFDAVTWIEYSFFTPEMTQTLAGFIKPGGMFIADVRNPEHSRTKSRSGNWSTWREEDGKFYLERHGTDALTGWHEDVWITIDPAAGLIEEKCGDKVKPLSVAERVALLKGAGFASVELRTMAGASFRGGPEPYWLWMIAKK